MKWQHVFYLFVCWLVEWLVVRVFFTSDQMCFSGIIVRIIKTFIIIMIMTMACIMVTRCMWCGKRKRFVSVGRMQPASTQNSARASPHKQHCGLDVTTDRLQYFGKTKHNAFTLFDLNAHFTGGAATVKLIYFTIVCEVCIYC